MADFTPGPWTAEPEGTHSFSIKARMAGEDRPTPIANTCWTNSADLNRENEANAHLISAAPDLLRACEADEAFINHFECCSECKSHLCNDGYELRVAADELRGAAIQKARGGAQ